MYRIVPPRENTVVLIGCGGTGGFVAEGLCRLLPDDFELILIDHDRIEEHNLLRQSFYREDIGKYKSQALAERLASLYGRRIAYSVQSFDGEITRDTGLGRGLRSVINRGLFIGCVDNAAARKTIAKNCLYGTWWLDAGNSEYSGQILIGNTAAKKYLKNKFNQAEMKTDAIPAPSLQMPSLLIPVPGELQTRQDCAERIEDGRQSPVINQVMAGLVLTFVQKLYSGMLEWVGAYIDMEAGTLSTVPAEPQAVARMLGMKIRDLINKPGI